MGERTENVKNVDLGDTLRELAEIIRSRRYADFSQSYTARLLNGQEDLLFKKIIEEATELVLALKDADHEHIRYEAADLLYHMLVALERSGISGEELAGELKARMK